MEQSQEYLKREFVHYISNTLSLLGADKDLIEKIRAVEEKPLTPEIIEEIRSFNYDQMNKVKTRLALCYSTTVEKD